MSNRFLWLLKYLLIPLTAALVGGGAVVWAMIRAGTLEKTMKGIGL